MDDKYFSHGQKKKSSTAEVRPSHANHGTTGIQRRQSSTIKKKKNSRQERFLACATRARALPPTHTQTFSFSSSFDSRKPRVSRRGLSFPLSFAFAFAFCACVSSFRSLSFPRASPALCGVRVCACNRRGVLGRARSSCSPSAALACERDEQTQAYHRQEQLPEHARAPYGAGGAARCARRFVSGRLHGVSIARGN